MAQPASPRIVRCLACREFISLDAPKCRFCGVAVDPRRYAADMDKENAAIREYARKEAWQKIGKGFLTILKSPFGHGGSYLRGTADIGDGWHDLFSDSGWLAKHSISPGMAIGFIVAVICAGVFLVYTFGEYVTVQTKRDGFLTEQEKREDDIRKANVREREAGEAVLAAERKAVEIAQRAKPDPNAKGYRTGKILVLKKEVWHLDPLQESLPTELRATKPDEVGTVVVITSNPVKIGKYLSPDKSRADQYEVDAYKLETTVEVIDVTLGTVVARQTYTTMPSEKVGVREYDSHVKVAEDGENPSSPVGKRPVRDILKFILDLPAK